MNTRHGFDALLRQLLQSRHADYDEGLAFFPAMRHIAGGRDIERSAESTSVISGFETEILT